MERTETWRGMVFPLVPYNLEKLVKKQHNLKWGVNADNIVFRHHGSSEERGSVTAPGSQALYQPDVRHHDLI